jgi:hypothetical protein
LGKEAAAWMHGGAWKSGIRISESVWNGAEVVRALVCYGCDGLVVMDG